MRTGYRFTDKDRRQKNGNQCTYLGQSHKMAQNTVVHRGAAGSDMTCVRKMMDAVGAFRLRNRRGLMSVHDRAQHCGQINGKQERR